MRSSSAGKSGVPSDGGGTFAWDAAMMVASSVSRLNRRRPVAAS